jgi:tetratricopeptide (TPR) repeat protein
MIEFLSKPLHRWLIVIVGLLVLAGVSPRLVGPMASRIRFTVTPNEELDRSSGLIKIFRGFQMSLADICYNKSAIYTHNGIRYTSLGEDILAEHIADQQEEDTQAATNPTSATAARDAHDHEHGGREDVLAITPQEHDFRGIIGRVEREVKPFPKRLVGPKGEAAYAHPPHVKEEEALPWLRIATLINPEHQQAWVGAASLVQHAKTPEASSRAIALLEQALQLNPLIPDKPYDKYSLVYLLAHLYLVKAKNPRRTIEILAPAIDHGEKDFPLLDALLGLGESQIQKDWLNYCFRDAVLAYREMGDYDKAIQTAQRAIRLFPEDGPLRTMLRRMVQSQKEKR